MSTLAYEIVGRVCVSCLSEKDPTDGEWDEQLSYLASKGVQIERVIIASQGGSPSMAQRKRLGQRRELASLVGALVTSDAGARRGVGALRWLGLAPQLKAFEPNALEDAFSHLGLSEQEGDACRYSIQKLTAQMAPTRGWARPSL